MQPLASLPSSPTKATIPTSLSIQNETLPPNELENTLSILTPSTSSSKRRWLLCNCDIKDLWMLDELQHQTSKLVTRLSSKLRTSCYNLPYSFLGLLFSFFAITHPSHVIGPLTTLVFIIASFHLIPQTSITYSCLLVCTSSRFHCIPPYSICFIIVPELSESQVYKPSTCYLLP